MTSDSDPQMPDASSQPVTRDLTGCSMGELQVLRRLGRGGMADVYLATQVSLDRQVAVKVLRPNLANDNSYVERFRREARAAAKLSHPNIVQVYEVGQWDGLHYISQEYIDGCNLREQIDRDGPLSLEQGVAVMLGVGAALDAASAQGITHRDIKPENIMLSVKGDVKVADFGLARISNPDFQSELTQVGLTLGTPLYMSPEQVQGKSVDVRSDLYSLGVTMFHVLTGRPPFEGDTPLAIAVKHLHDTADRMSESRVDDHVPEWLDEVLIRLMAKEPQKRFETPASLVDYLQRKSAGTASMAALGTIPIRLEATRELQSVMNAEPSRGRSTLAWIAACAIPLFAIFAGIGYARNHRPASVTAMLSVETATIERQDSVQRQFFEAMRVNTPAGWEAVWQNYPADDTQENRIYAAKARLQLARLYDQQDSPIDVLRVVKTVMTDPDLPPHLTTIAVAYREHALRRQNKNNEAADMGELLQSKLDGLNQEQKNLFRIAVPRGVLDRVDL